MPYPLKHHNDSNGFTLIEVLAALVILSIVLVSFFSFFNQSALFTRMNRENISAINLAQDTIVTIQQNPSTFQHTITASASFTEEEKSILNIDSSGTFLHFPNYKLQLTISKDSSYNLYKLNVQIFDLEGNLLTETYHYLRGISS